MIEIATDKELSAQAALAEFTALRTESLQAYSAEWNIVAFQLTATGVLFSFALTNNSRIGFLLIVPIVSYVLSGRYLRNDRNFILIGIYIRTKLSGRIPGDGLEWEEWYKNNSPVQTLLSFAYGPWVFSGISIVALAWVVPYILHANISTASRWMLGVVWLLDLTATAISIYTIIMTQRSLTKLDKAHSDDAKVSHQG